MHLESRKHANVNMFMDPPDTCCFIRFSWCCTVLQRRVLVETHSNANGKLCLRAGYPFSTAQFTCDVEKNGDGGGEERWGGLERNGIGGGGGGGVCVCVCVGGGGDVG